jgi:hypothetical protein
MRLSQWRDAGVQVLIPEGEAEARRRGSNPSQGFVPSPALSRSAQTMDEAFGLPDDEGLSRQPSIGRKAIPAAVIIDFFKEDRSASNRRSADTHPVTSVVLKRMKFCMPEQFDKSRDFDTRTGNNASRSA